MGLDSDFIGVMFMIKMIVNFASQEEREISCLRNIPIFPPKIHITDVKSLLADTHLSTNLFLDQSVSEFDFVLSTVCGFACHLMCTEQAPPVCPIPQSQGNSLLSRSWLCET